MNIKCEERTFDFSIIRDGCVFRCGDDIYIKGENKYATNLKTGQRVEPSPNDNKWKICYTYPKAYMTLY